MASKLVKDMHIADKDGLRDSVIMAIQDKNVMKARQRVSKIQANFYDLAFEDPDRVDPWEEIIQKTKKRKRSQFIQDAEGSTELELK